MDYMPRTKKLLKFLGLWPQKNKDKTYLLRQRLQQILMIYFLTGGVIYLMSIIGDSKIPILTRIESILCFLIVTSLSYGYISFYSVRENVETIFDMIKRLDEFGQLEKYKGKNELIDYFSVFMVWFCWLGSVIIAGIPLFRMSSCYNFNLVHNTTILCGFSFGIKYPFDINSRFWLYFKLAIELLSLQLFVTKGTIFIGVGMGIFEAVVTRLQDLCTKLREFNATDDFNQQKICLHHCIYYHIRIIELADEINNSYSLITLPCIVSHNVIIGIGFMGIMNGISVLSFLPTVTWVVTLFAACYTGERVIKASHEIAVVAYGLNWYTDSRLRRDILLMIMRAQRPLRIECGKFSDISFETFKTIMQSAYAYATMKSGF